MTSYRIFITGASGCIGHYVTEALIQNTPHELYLLVRNPAKLRIDLEARSGVHLLEGNLRDIDRFQGLLQTIDVAILIATAWGDPQETYDINVTQTLALVQFLQTGVCRQILYFSTESILDQSNQLLPQAGTLGTDYIRTKFRCFQELEKLPIAPRITALFPTLVFGGNDTKPYSHLTAGLPEILGWLWLIRFFQADASFHFIHAYDIAQVVCYLVDRPQKDSSLAAFSPVSTPPESPASIRKIVLGNGKITVNQAIEQICHYRRLPLYFRMPLSVGLAEVFIRLFRIQMAEWDRFCLHYRHFVHENPINPTTFGLSALAPTVPDLLRACGIEPDLPPSSNPPIPVD